LLLRVCVGAFSQKRKRELREKNSKMFASIWRFSCTSMCKVKSTLEKSEGLDCHRGKLSRDYRLKKALKEGKVNKGEGQGTGSGAWGN